MKHLCCGGCGFAGEEKGFIRQGLKDFDERDVSTMFWACPKCGSTVINPANENGLAEEDEKSLESKLGGLPEFVELMRAGLRVGQAKYHDDYLVKDNLAEIIQELRDIAVYAYLEYRKLKRLIEP